MLGMAKMVSAKESIGAIMSRRGGLGAAKLRLVGLAPVDPARAIPAGSHLFTEGTAQSLDTDQGWVTSACYSPHLESYIALGYLENGDQRAGEVIVAANPIEGGTLPVKVVSAHFVDPEGGRLRD